MSDTVRTRFAPSPTGYLHIGGVRTALFSWLYARRYEGQFILRIEDTDRERSTEEAIEAILNGMDWLGLDYDEGPFYQTKRFERYHEVIKNLLGNNHAYYCYCSKEELSAMREAAMAKGEKPRYDGRCRERRSTPPKDIKPVVRFRNPDEGEVIFDDLIQGRVVYKNTELDDLIIARSDGTPTYNLTVVIDDMDMKITHVIRGDDHLNNTPRQINIFKSLTDSLPRYAHVPLILGEDGKRLSKRHGAVSVLEYKQQGYLPEALLNYLVRLGWSHGDQEIFSFAEMIKYFEITDVNKSAASVNPEKLLWLNQHYLKEADNEKLSCLLKELFDISGIDTRSGPDLIDLVAVQKERTKTIAEMVEQSKYFFVEFDDYDEKLARKHLKPEFLDTMDKMKGSLNSISSWDDEHIHQVITHTAEVTGNKLGKIAQPLRVAVTGSVISPSIDITLRLLGKEKTISRLDRALDYIRHQATLDSE